MAATLLLVLLMPASIALGAGEDAGTNLGNMLRSWAGPLFMGICALAGLYFLFTRRFNEMAVWLCVALVVGVFVYAPGAIRELSQTIGKMITG